MGHKAKSAVVLYPQHFLEIICPSHKITLKVVERSREASCVSSWPRSGRPAKVGLDLLLYVLIFLMSSTKEMSVNCGLSINRVRIIRNELSAHPHRQHQPNQADMVWMVEICFSRKDMYNRQNTDYWALKNLTGSADVRHQMLFSINVCCEIYNNRLIAQYFTSEC